MKIFKRAACNGMALLLAFVIWLSLNRWGILQLYELLIIVAIGGISVIPSSVAFAAILPDNKKTGIIRVAVSVILGVASWHISFLFTAGVVIFFSRMVSLEFIFNNPIQFMRSNNGHVAYIFVMLVTICIFRAVRRNRRMELA